MQASIGWTLAANIETPVPADSGNLIGTGNALSNPLTGNAGNNLLSGGAGNDTLAAGAGSDTLSGLAGGPATSATPDDIFVGWKERRLQQAPHAPTSRAATLNCAAVRRARRPA